MKRSDSSPASSPIPLPVGSPTVRLLALIATTVVLCCIALTFGQSAPLRLDTVALSYETDSARTLTWDDYLFCTKPVVLSNGKDRAADTVTLRYNIITPDGKYTERRLRRTVNPKNPRGTLYRGRYYYRYTYHEAPAGRPPPGSTDSCSLLLDFGTSSACGDMALGLQIAGDTVYIDLRDAPFGGTVKMLCQRHVRGVIRGLPAGVWWVKDPTWDICRLLGRKPQPVTVPKTCCRSE